VGVGVPQKTLTCPPFLRWAVRRVGMPQLAADWGTDEGKHGLATRSSAQKKGEWRASPSGRRGVRGPAEKKKRGGPPGGGGDERGNGQLSFYIPSSDVSWRSARCLAGLGWRYRCPWWGCVKKKKRDGQRQCESLQNQISEEERGVRLAGPTLFTSNLAPTWRPEEVRPPCATRTRRWRPTRSR